GLTAARLGAAQPLKRDAQLALKVVVEAQPRSVVAGERHGERALVAVADGDARRRLEFCGKAGPQPLAAAVESVKRDFAGLGLNPGRQHAGGRPARATARLAALEDVNCAAGHRQPPSDSKANGARTDDRDGRARGGNSG